MGGYVRQIFNFHFMHGLHVRETLRDMFTASARPSAAPSPRALPAQQRANFRRMFRRRFDLAKFFHEAAGKEMEMRLDVRSMTFKNGADTTETRLVAFPVVVPDSPLMKVLSNALKQGWDMRVLVPPYHDCTPDHDHQPHRLNVIAVQDKNGKYRLSGHYSIG